MNAKVVAWHHVAHAPRGTRPLARRDDARWLWRRLSACCARAQGSGARVTPACAVLMPNHVHLVHFADPLRTHVALVKLIAAFARFRGLVRGWSAPQPEPISHDKLWRQLRYVHLNPCRAGLASDPLEWTFSTHRDAVGATYDPWLRLDELPGLRPRSEGGRLPELQRDFHAYVSSDPSVHPAGSAFPSPAPRRQRALLGLEQIQRAAVAASPWCPPARLRERSVMLARHQGWRAAAPVAEAAGLSRMHVYRIWRCGDGVDLAPAALCLGDTRLHAGVPGG